jgi:hypothetical protein
MFNCSPRVNRHPEAACIPFMTSYPSSVMPAMASQVVMLATYPEVFAGGAIIAGLPYGCAGNVEQAFELVFTAQKRGARALGDRARAASRHHGPWPKISVWRGTNDPVVQSSNADNIIRQWTNVHSLAECPSHQELIGSHTRRIWSDATSEALIEAFAISGIRSCRERETCARKTLGDPTLWARVGQSRPSNDPQTVLQDELQ